MKKIAGLLPILFLVSCSRHLIETNLYFGLSKPNGDSVSIKEWEQFKMEKIARAFPEGSSVLSVSGNWFDPEKKILVTEPSYQVVYFHKKSKEISSKIDSLRNDYKVQFGQQSVLRLDRKASVSF